MGFYYSSTNDQSPTTGGPASATGTTAEPVANVDGVIPPNSTTQVPDLAPGFTPPPVTSTNPTATDYIMTDSPAMVSPVTTPEPPKPAEPSVSPAFNPDIGAPATPSLTTPTAEPAKSEPLVSPRPPVDPLLAAPELDAEDDTITPAYPEIDAAQEAALPHDEPTTVAVTTPTADPAPAVIEPLAADESVAEVPAEPTPVSIQPATSPAVPPEPEITEPEPEAPAAEPEPKPTPSVTESEPESSVPSLESIKEKALDQLPPTSPSTPTDLAAIKQQALQQLSPLFNHLNQDPEEKFNTTMMMLQATDDESLVATAYEVAQTITDEKVRAQALMDIVNEINYFTKNNEV